MSKKELREQIIDLLNKASELSPIDQRELLEEINMESGTRIYKINDTAGGSI